MYKGKNIPQNNLRLIIVFIAAIATVLIGGFVGERKYEESLMKTTEERLAIIARSNALLLQEYILAHCTMIESFANTSLTRTILIGNTSGKEIDPEYAKFVDNYLESSSGRIGMVYFVDTNRKLVQVRSVYSDYPVTIDNIESIGETFDTKRSHIGTVVLPGTKVNSVSFSEPVFNKGEFIGVVCAIVHLDGIYSLINQIGGGGQSYVYACDSDSRLLLHPIPELIGPTLEELQHTSLGYVGEGVSTIAEEIRQGKSGIHYYTFWKVGQGLEKTPIKKLTAYYPVELGTTRWSVGITTSYSSLIEPIVQFRDYILLISLIIIVALVLFFGYYLTDSARKYQILFESQELLTTAFDHIPNAIFWKDLNFTYRWANKTFLRDAGLESLEELVGKTDKELAWKEEEADYYQSCDEQVMRTGREVCHYEETQHDASGTSRWLDTSKIPMRDAKGDVVGVIGIYEDISERKEFEDSLIRLSEDASRLSEMKSRFLANISHEVRTPMNAILGVSEFLLDTKLDEEQQSFARTIKLSGDLLMDIINSVLDFSKIEAGRLELSCSPFNLHESVEQSIECFAHAAEQTELELHFMIGAGVPVQVIGDKGRFRQILVNLIGNALKFTSEGRIIIGVERYEQGKYHKSDGDEVSIAEVDGKIPIVVTVEDTGEGIRDEAQVNIFEAFVQADTSASRKHGGTGLGLTISAEIAWLMGGDIWFNSTIGQGSKFCFVVQMEESAEPEPEPEQPGEQEQVCLKGVKILVVDDDAMNKMVVCRMLSRQEIETVSAANGQEAVDLYQTDEYDLILMDVMMPVMNGHDATQKIREYETEADHKHTPIIALTACTSPDDVRICFDVGCDGYLAKPIRSDDLFDKIRELIQGK